MWQQPIASDNSGYVKEVTCSPQAGSLFLIGQTKVTCEAVDDAGNSASCHFFVGIVGMLKLLQEIEKLIQSAWLQVKGKKKTKQNKTKQKQKQKQQKNPLLLEIRVRTVSKKTCEIVHV